MTSKERFPDEAERAFSFLKDAGFRLVERGRTRLRYESARVVLTIEWDPRSGEMNVFFGLQPRYGEARDSFALADVLGMEGVDLPERGMPFQVADEGRLGPFVARLADDTRIHAQPAIAGDRMFFHRLKAFRNAQSDRYMLAMKLRRVRSEADDAWHKRDFRRVIDLYTSIQDHLSAFESGRLAYAKKHHRA